MGADNWAICPNCRLVAAKSREKLGIKADAAYGKKPSSEYLALRQEAEQPLDLKQTLREDYEIGIGMDGMFGVNYRAHCNTCDVSFKFEHCKEAVHVPETYKEDAEQDDPFGYNFRK